MDQQLNNNDYQYGSVFESGVAAAASCDLTYNTQPIIHGTTIMNTDSAEAPFCQDTEQPVIHKSMPALKLSLDVAYEWQNIGVFLDVPDPSLKRIETDNRRCNDCL